MADDVLTQIHHQLDSIDRKVEHCALEIRAREAELRLVMILMTRFGQVQHRIETLFDELAAFRADQHTPE